MKEELRLTDGLTAKKWGEEYFEYSFCVECGGDLEDHDIIPFLGNWFARCKEERKEGERL